MQRAPQAVGALALVLVLLQPTLALGQAPTPAPTPPSTLPDLEVVAVGLAAPAPMRVDGAAQGSRVFAVVRNNGPVAVTAYQIHYSWVAPGGAESGLNGATAGQSTDVHEHRLDPGREARHEWAWTLQAGQEGAGKIKARAEVGSASGDRDPSNNARAEPIFVPVHAMALQVATPAREIHPDETVFLRVQARNLGNLEETVQLAVQPPGGDARRLQATLEPAQLAVPPGGTAVATLYVAFPFDDDLTPVDAGFTVRAATAYGATLTAITPRVTSTDEPYNASRYAAAIDGPSTVFLDPGASAAFSYAVRNTGLLPDILRVAPEVPAGWTLAVQPERAALEPGESATFQLTVGAPPTGAPGNAANAVLAVASDHPLPPTSRAVSLRIAGAALEASLPLAPQTVYRGDAPSFTVAVANRGDRPSEPASVVAALSLANGSVRSVAVGVPALAAGAEARREIGFGTLGAPGVAALSLRLGATGPVLGGMPVDVRDPRLRVRAAAPAAGVAGQDVAYAVPPNTFLLSNEGSHPETFLLAVNASAGQPGLVGADRVTLAPGESRSVATTHRLPMPAGDLRNATLTLAATLDARPAFRWANTTRTEVQDTVAPAVFAAQRPRTWSLLAPMPLAVEASDGGGVASVLAVLQPPAGANRTLPLTLAADGTWTAAVPFAGPGAHRIALLATDLRGNQAVALAWDVDVAAGPVPRLVVPVPANGTWEASKPLLVRVEDAAVDRVSYVIRQAGAVVLAGNASVQDGAAAIPLGQLEGDAVVHLSTVASGARGETTITLRLMANGTDTPPAPGSGGVLKVREEAPLGPSALAALAAALARARRARDAAQVARPRQQRLYTARES